MKVAALALVGCVGSSPPGGGTILWESFPYDGKRTWEYVSTDDALTYKLVVEIFGPGEPGLLETTVYTLHYKQDCFGNDPSCVTGEILRIIKWSSDPTHGVLVHGFGDLLAMQDFDPPIKISADDGDRGDSWTTTTGGANWTSTYVGVEACPESMVQEWPNCFRFDVTTDAGEGYPLAGTWWSAQSQGAAGLEIATETGLWQLNDFWCDMPGCGEPWY
jgi:hypothetical protein